MGMPGDRILQMFDLRTTQFDQQGFERFGKDAAKHAVKVLRQFVEPALRDGDDIQAMGEHWVAVLADAERIASVERLFQAAKAHRNDLLTIEVQILNFTAEKFRKHLRDDLVKVERGTTEIGTGHLNDTSTVTGNTFESVIPKDKAKAFLKKARGAASQSLAAPKISVKPLQRASVSVVNQTSYIRDFTVERNNHQVVADPVVGVVWDGHKSEMCATFLPGGRIGLSCSVHFQELHRPIPEASITVVESTLPVTIQLPRTSGVRLANVAEVVADSLVVLASQRSDGEYLVAIVKANATGHR